MFISLKIRRKTAYVSIFDGFIRFLRVLKAMLKIPPIDHAYVHGKPQKCYYFDHKLLLVWIFDQQITSRQDVRFYGSLRNTVIFT